VLEYPPIRLSSLETDWQVRHDRTLSRAGRANDEQRTLIVERTIDLLRQMRRDFVSAYESSAPLFREGVVHSFAEAVGVGDRVGGEAGVDPTPEIFNGETGKLLGRRVVRRLVPAASNPRFEGIESDRRVFRLRLRRLVTQFRQSTATEVEQSVTASWTVQDPVPDLQLRDADPAEVLA
jgi:hypothetical protein